MSQVDAGLFTTRSPLSLEMGVCNQQMLTAGPYSKKLDKDRLTI